MSDAVLRFEIRFPGAVPEHLRERLVQRDLRPGGLS
jgi:hypothetical protein